MLMSVTSPRTPICASLSSNSGRAVASIPVPARCGRGAMPRLFTGLEIPHEWRASLARLKQPLPGARWIEPVNFHITLRFAGDIDNRIASEFADFLAEIDCHAFELRLKGVGAFGGNEPRQLWAGVEGGQALE